MIWLRMELVQCFRNVHVHLSSVSLRGCAMEKVSEKLAGPTTYKLQNGVGRTPR